MWTSWRPSSTLLLLRSSIIGKRLLAGLAGTAIGALLFGYFLTITQTPQKVTEFLTGLGLGRYALLAIIMFTISSMTLTFGMAT